MSMDLVADRTTIAQAVDSWRDKLQTDKMGGISLPDQSLWGAVYLTPRKTRSIGKKDFFASDFRLQVATAPNTVTVQIPVEGIDENVLGSVAYEDGKLWILRQGRLHSSTDESGRSTNINFDEFPSLTDLNPVQVSPRPKNSSRRYYRVACLQDSRDVVRSQTSEFVRQCSLARARKADGSLAEQNRRLLSNIVRLREGVPETVSTIQRRATEARAIERRQTAVWAALKSLLGEKMSNPLFDGLGTDVFVQRTSRLPLLIEIKTDHGAASVETALGQLLIYSYLFSRSSNGSEVERVLLMPQRPQASLEEALRMYDIKVYTYGDWRKPEFSQELREVCI